MSLPKLPTGSAPPVPLTSEDVRQQLQEEMLGLNVVSFEHLVAHLLARLGYFDVKVLRGAPPHGRRSHKGRTGHGGIDLLAYSQTRLSRSLCVTQVKQYRRPVSRHFVDSLRGAMLRTEAREGLLITTSTFSPVARRAAESDHIAPVRLVDGEELLNLLFACQIGVRQKRSGQWNLDWSFLRRLPASRVKRPSPKRHQPARPPDQCDSQQRETDASHSLSTNSTEGGGMTWSTHVMAGLNSLWLLQSVPGAITPENIVAVVAGAAFGVLLPDLDAAESKIKHLRIIGIKPFAPIAVLFYQGLGHRGLLHSLIGLSLLAAASLLLVPWSGWTPSVALVLGYASHLAMDACTRSGIPFFYPDKRRCHLLPQRWRITTGSQAEDVLFVALSLTAMLLFLGLLFLSRWLPGS